jgi:nucleoside-diphosphate-sugar epimerase
LLHSVIGLDKTNYYDPALKAARLDLLRKHPGFTFLKLDLADRAGIRARFEQHGFAVVVHLAAQAGMRYSLQNPHAYADSNLEGFVNIREARRSCSNEKVERDDDSTKGHHARPGVVVTGCCRPPAAELAP